MRLVSILNVAIVFGLFTTVFTMPVLLHDTIQLRSDESRVGLLPRKQEPPKSFQFIEGSEALHQPGPQAQAPSPPRTGAAGPPEPRPQQTTTETQTTSIVKITFIPGAETAVNEVIREETERTVKLGLTQTTAAFDARRRHGQIFEFTNFFPGNALAQRQIIHFKVDDPWQAGQCGSGCLGSAAFVDNLGGLRSYHARVRQLDEDEEEPYERYPRVSLPPLPHP
ncbi:hypothetical protein DFH05DRAFT_818 [Lentinula detonsa]|uniref:Uncharacterized protein n=1 Tax=Lentinula detonsa TaxID=2804962 RepID=A0A9W8P9P7_9AGAR|nr:hypothetical protein DFH05DRAFT_818 [Lentinula detonsa]